MDHVPIPSQGQLALALTIVKHKPAELDIKDYILQTRQFVKNSKKSDRAYSQDKFFDSASFWKQAYEKSEAEQSRLLDRIYELEQRNEALLSKVQARDITVEEPDKGSSKRKATKNLTRNPTMRKRTKTQLPSASNSVAVDLRTGPGQAPNNLVYMEEVTASFMRHFYMLQKVLQKRPNNQDIIQATVNLCKISADELLSIFYEKKPASERTKKTIFTNAKQSHLLRVLHSAECAVNLLLQALKRLSGSGNEAHVTGLVTYHIVSLYKTVMDILEQYCKVKSEQSRAGTKSRAKPSKQKQTAKSKQAAPINHPGNQVKIADEGAKQITGLLNQMMASLELSCPGHRGLIEGFLFILLRRIGKLLCLFVFQDLQLRPDLKIDPLKLSLPDGLIGAELDAISLCAAQMEGRYLIENLERVIAILAACRPSSPSVTMDDDMKRMHFISSIKSKLQPTLLEAVFGGNSPWGDSLQCPTQPDGREADQFQHQHQLPTLSDPEWFIQEVWRLLGWEVLMKGNSLKK